MGTTAVEYLGKKSKKSKESKESKESKKSKLKRIQQIVDRWLPFLNDTALRADIGVYEHPWVPVEVLREIERVLSR